MTADRLCTRPLFACAAFCFRFRAHPVQGLAHLAYDHDIVIAGAGIAGLTAALTAARLGRKTMVLAGDILGGQLISIEKIDGYPGFPDGIPGYDLCPIAQEQAMTAGAEFSSTELKSLARAGDSWKLDTGDGEMSARSVIIA